jgi:hypothetical protein
LHLGKIIRFDSNRKPLGDAYLEGVVEHHSAVPRHSRDEYFARAVEAFLILHRNHELRVVPEGVDEMLEKTLGYFHAPSVQEIITEAKGTPVDWTGEKRMWQAKIGGDRAGPRCH